MLTQSTHNLPGGALVQPAAGPSRCECRAEQAKRVSRTDDQAMALDPPRHRRCYKAATRNKRGRESASAHSSRPPTHCFSIYGRRVLSIVLCAGPISVLVPSMGGPSSRQTLVRQILSAAPGPSSSAGSSSFIASPILVTQTWRQPGRESSGSNHTFFRRRCVSTSAVTRAEETQLSESTSSVSQAADSTADAEGDAAPSDPSPVMAQQPGRGGRAGRGALPPYKQWIRGAGRAAFEKPPPGRGPFWIGETPFPLNPSFKPPAPLSHSVKMAMLNLHWSDPHKNSVHTLSSRFRVPVERVTAVLRLMALETEYQKGVSGKANADGRMGILAISAIGTLA